MTQAAERDWEQWLPEDQQLACFAALATQRDIQ